MYRILLSIIILSAALIFCSKPTVNTSSIPETSEKASDKSDSAIIDKAPLPPIPPISSTLNVPLIINTDVAQKMINQQLDSLLYQCDTMTIAGMKNVKLRVWKKDSIKLSLNGDELLYRIPLKIWLQFSFTVGAFGLSHTEYQDVEASIALTFRSRIFVKNNWKIVTMTHSDGYEWLSDPIVKVRFLTIPVKPVADYILSKQTASFGEMVDKAVSSMVDVKKMITPLWNQMQSPILLMSDPDSLWLCLHPQGIYMTQLEGSDGVISGSIGIKSVAETFFGKKPMASATDSLPEFVIPGKVDSTFIINLYNEISYESATQITRNMLVGRNFTSGKYEAIINDINIYGMNGYAVVSLDLSGYYQGKVYVIGKVNYDTVNQTITINDLEFDISTQNRLIKTANTFFHELFISKLQPYLKFPIRETLLQSQVMAQKMLCNKEISKNIFINGSLDTLSIAGITCAEEGIRATLLAKGILTVNIRE